MKVIISILFSFILMGCGASGPVYTVKPPQTGKAHLVIYRTPTAGSSIDKSHVLVDKKMVGALWRESYIEVDVKPGKHNVIVYFHQPGGEPTISVPKPVRIDVTLKPNETKYIKYDVFIPYYYSMYVWKSIGDLEVVKRDKAIQELSQKYQESEYFDENVKLPVNKWLDNYISKL